MISLPESLLWSSSLFRLKHTQHVSVHDRQINTTCDDEDKDEPADWSIAVARSTKGEVQKRATKDSRVPPFKSNTLTSCRAAP
jgi:hypothetical protein